jgi:hypothetical protein
MSALGTTPRRGAQIVAAVRAEAGATTAKGAEDGAEAEGGEDGEEESGEPVWEPEVRKRRCGRKLPIAVTEAKKCEGWVKGKLRHRSSSGLVWRGWLPLEAPAMISVELAGGDVTGVVSPIEAKLAPTAVHREDPD